MKYCFGAGLNESLKCKRLILYKRVITLSFNSAVVFLTYYKLELNSYTFKIRLLENQFTLTYD